MGHIKAALFWAYLMKYRLFWCVISCCYHYNDAIMSAMASQITSLTIVYSTIYSGADKKTPKLRVTDLCEGNSPVTGKFHAQRTSNAENISIWWRHHDNLNFLQIHVI